MEDDNFFMALAFLTANRSKNLITQVNKYSNNVTCAQSMCRLVLALSEMVK